MNFSKSFVPYNGPSMPCHVFSRSFTQAGFPSNVEYAVAGFCTFTPSNVMYAMSENKALSIVGFEATPNMGVDESALASTLKSVAKNGPEFIYRGPYATTGQRVPATVAAGETVRYLPDDPNSNQEWRSMCWYVKGVIEKTDPQNPTGPDKDALVPDGSFTPTLGPTGSVLMSPPGAPAGTGLNCKQNY